MRRRLAFVTLLVAVSTIGLSTSPTSAAPSGGSSKASGQAAPQQPGTGTGGEVAKDLASTLAMDAEAAQALERLRQVGPYGASGENEEYRRRMAAQFVSDHSDRSGRLRPDLWRKAVAEFGELAISTAWRTLPNTPVSALANPSAAPASASYGPITGSQWKQIGPAPMIVDDETNFQGDGPNSGEIVDIAIDPRGTTDRVIYVATNGGVWKTIDGGVTWKPKTDTLPSLSIGALALDPANPNIVYAGTGNRFDGAGQFFGQGFNGVGIYKSVDAGETWTTLGGAIFNGQAITKMVMPAANTLLVASTNGVFKSVDGGLSFGNNSPAFNNSSAVLGGYITDLDRDTATASTVYASQAGTGVFKSVDSGTSWGDNAPDFDDGDALFTPTGTVGRITFAQGTNPDNATMLVAVANTTGFGGSSFNAMWRSDDTGGSFNQIFNTMPGGDNCWCGYAFELNIDPQDENRVYFGSIQVYASTASPPGSGFATSGDGQVHDDIHNFTFSPSSHWGGGGAPTRVWIGHDAGLTYSTDGGSDWINQNGTPGQPGALATNLFFQIAMGQGPTNNQYTYGGTQDTGTLNRRPGDAGTDWHMKENGDGGAVGVDPTNAQRAYAAGNRCYKVTTDGGNNWSGGLPPGLPGGFCAGFFAIDPNSGANVFTGQGQQLYLSTDTAASYTLIETFPSGISAVGTSKADSNTLWVGLADGTVQVSHDVLSGTSATWNAFTVPGAPAQAVRGIAADPEDPFNAVAVYPGFNGLTSGVSKHVFQTFNDGANWANVSGVVGGSQNLPDIPLHSVVIDPGTTPHSIIVSSDSGVARTLDGGASWQRLGTGLPNALSKSLAFDYTVNPPILRIGTYGRSTWELGPVSGPQLAVNADLGFDRVAVGKRGTRIVQLFNVGTSDLHIISFTRTAGSPEFSITSGPATPVTIQPGEEIDYTIEYKPTNRGDDTAEFRIQSDDTDSPITTLNASGTGVTGEIEVSGDLNFGTVARGTTQTRDLLVQNSGEGELDVTSVTMQAGSDPAFSIDAVPGTPQVVQPGSSVTFKVRFSPPASASAGHRDGTVEIVSNDPDTPSITRDVDGDVGVPSTGASTGSLDFAGIPVDDRTEPYFEEQTVTVSNQASCPECDVRITNLSITGPNAGDFTLTGAPTLPYKIGAGNHLDLTVRFDPSDQGARSATLTITSDDPANPIIVVALQGTGLIPGITTPDTQIFFPPTVYETVCAPFCGSRFDEAFSNNGQAELIVDSIAFTGSPAFSGPGATSPPSRFAPNDGGVEPITFRPTAPARALRGTMTITDTLGPDNHPIDRIVSLCGESTGRGIRVLAVDAQGNPAPLVKALRLQSHGFHKNVSVNLKNQTLTTIDPPTTCERVQFQYENQGLPNTDKVGQQGSYYSLTVTVGNQAKTQTFTLALNEFKTIVLTIP